MLVNFKDLLKKAAALKASDIHLRSKTVPYIRVNGQLFKLNIGPLTSEYIENMLIEILPKNISSSYQDISNVDFSYMLSNTLRFRVNLSIQMGEYALCFRIVPNEVPDFETLKLPNAINSFCNFESGLVLVTGATGSGKTTTLASILEYINKNKQKHIITIEDPIEFMYKSKKCLISQRQIGIDINSFPEGIKYALRQDPDIILVGEIRDKETLEAALFAAETGHLVFSTLHTINASSTINRVLSFYDPSQYNNVRSQLAASMRSIISQRLIPKKNEEGRIVACEILNVTTTVADFIIKNELDEVYKIMKSGSFGDMISFNNYLLHLIDIDAISKESALEFSSDKKELEYMIRQKNYEV